MASEVIDRSVVEWRKKAREGTLSVDEMKQALAKIREERMKSGETSAKSTATKVAKKEKAAPVNSDDLLKGLADL